MNNTVQILTQGMFVAINNKDSSNSNKTICHLIADSNPLNTLKVMFGLVKVNTYKSPSQQPFTNERVTVDYVWKDWVTDT